MEKQEEKVRIDKWLWAVRIYKTRTQAAEECEKGRVTINGFTVKPSHIVKEGEIICVRKPPVLHTYRVLGIIKNRVSAQVARQYVEDLTSEEEIAKRQMMRLAMNFQRDPGSGRPTKKERRELDRLRNQGDF
ncbi:MAG TPA: RNA-binding S4 domain-containing protein [Bacteroidales bacterium]|nr:RNA-binding S4 domain-containing protein [Bacteroidales bacterium]HOK99244.1 RNA-binding S4 domain-containing protein [Bacteroidales bacterium]HPO66149.1 RNA-binding S4 domain-containing protein [Bacteroidales bacterium]